MNVHPDVNFEELARSTDDFNGAQLKAVCVEAGMLALRRDATEVASYIFKFLDCFVTITSSSSCRIDLVHSFYCSWFWLNWLPPSFSETHIA